MTDLLKRAAEIAEQAASTDGLCNCKSCMNNRTSIIADMAREIERLRNVIRKVSPVAYALQVGDDPL